MEGRLEADCLSGVVNFANLMQIRHAGEAVIDGTEEALSFDLSQLEEANSAAVALLVAWYRAAENNGKRIVFVDAPPELRNIIAFSGLDQVLPLA